MIPLNFLINPRLCITININLFCSLFSFNYKLLNSPAMSLRYNLRILKGFTKLNTPILCRITLSSAVPGSTI